MGPRTTQKKSSLIPQFEVEWSSHFGEIAPFGWTLREARISTGQPWLRLHALPKSKRYASDDGERVEIRRRAYILGSELLGEGTECWMVEAHAHHYAGNEESWLPNNTYEQPDDEDPDEFSWRIHISLIQWKRNNFDPILQRIADDKSGPIIWMARGDGAVFAPYDGGFDLFPPSWDQVARLRATYATWLSLHPEGL